MNIKKTKKLIDSIPKDVVLVAASKYVDAKGIEALYNIGVRNFGENRVAAFEDKYLELFDLDIVWHFIGHLQTNKAKEIINDIDYLHSLDSLKLAKLIERERKEPLKCFIEVNLLGQESKNGLSLDELDSFIEKILENKKIILEGFMVMSKQNSTKEELLDTFSKAKRLLEEKNKIHNLNMKNLSMGMSADYKEAISCGATHIRLGRILFND